MLVFCVNKGRAGGHPTLLFLPEEERKGRKHRPPCGTRLLKGRCREVRLWSRNDIPSKVIIFDGESLRAFKGSETCHPRGCKPKQLPMISAEGRR